MRPSALIVAAVATLAFSLPLSAQNVDVHVRGVWDRPEGSTHVHGGAAAVELATGSGIEAGADIFWSDRYSTDLSLASVNHDLDAAAFGQHVDLGATRFVPLSVTLKIHSNRRGPFDLHAGLGLSYAVLGGLSDTAELQTLGVSRIRFHDSIAPLASLGLDYRLGGRWALTLDGKYFRIRTKTTASYAAGGSEGADLHLDQLLIGAGISCRF